MLKLYIFIHNSKTLPCVKVVSGNTVIVLVGPLAGAEQPSHSLLQFTSPACIYKLSAFSFILFYTGLSRPLAILGCSSWPASTYLMSKYI